MRMESGEEEKENLYRLRVLFACGSVIYRHDDNLYFCFFFPCPYFFIFQAFSSVVFINSLTRDVSCIHCAAKNDKKIQAKNIQKWYPVTGFSTIFLIQIYRSYTCLFLERWIFLLVSWFHVCIKGKFFAKSVYPDGFMEIELKMKFRQLRFMTKWLTKVISEVMNWRQLPLILISQKKKKF